MSRGAPPQQVSDETPLDGDQVDVARRIGWLLRTARRLAPDAPTMAQVAADLGVSVALVHRAETGGIRSGHLVDGFERALGLPTGSLRAPVDALCRTYAYAPPDRNPAAGPLDVTHLSMLTDRVSRARPSGGEWLAWARAMSNAAAVGMPLAFFTARVDHLACELTRAVGTSFTTRYEALALLRSGPYASTTLAAIDARVCDPDAQVVIDLVCAAGENPDREVQEWILDLLGHPRDPVVRAAAVTLSGLADTAGDEDLWTGVLPPLLRAFNASVPGSSTWRWTSYALRKVPAAVRAAEPLRPNKPLALPEVTPVPRPPDHTSWPTCVALADDASRSVGLDGQPMLARMVFEMVDGSFESHAVNDALVLHALPRLADAVGERLARLAEQTSDPVRRDRILRRINSLVHDGAPACTRRWIDSSDDELRRHGLRLAGTGGLDVDPATLRRAWSDGLAEESLYAAGMNGSPFLTELLADPGTDEELRRAARWWRADGPRVVDPPGQGHPSPRSTPI